jgi:hypothetical protein
MTRAEKGGWGWGEKDMILSCTRRVIRLLCSLTGSTEVECF